MSRMTRCIMMALLVFSFSVAALGADPLPPIDPQWGDNVALTVAITEGQSLKDLFSDKTTLKEMVDLWLVHLASSTLPGAGAVTTALGKMNSALNEDLQVASWKMSEIFTMKWESLQGKDITKTAVRAWFGDLRAHGVMFLSFLTRKEDEAPSQELLDTLAAIEKNPKLWKLTYRAIYSESSDTYSCEDINLIGYAMDTVKLLRTDLPDGLQVKTIGCCNRTTKKCNPAGTGTCNQCPAGSGTCCLGSTWCP